MSKKSTANRLRRQTEDLIIDVICKYINERETHGDDEVVGELKKQANRIAKSYRMDPLYEKDSYLIVTPARKVG